MKCIAYQATSVVVVKFHQGLDVAAFSIGGVHEVSRLFESKFHVVTAPSPLPVSLGRQTLLHFGGSHELIDTITCAIRRGSPNRNRGDERWKALTFRCHLVAGAFDEVTHGAGPGHRVSDPGRGDGVHETRLPRI